MINIQKAYSMAKKGKPKECQLSSILDFETAFGFLFGTKNGQVVYGSSYILIDKHTEKISIIPTTPANVPKLQAAKKIPLTTIKIR